MLDESPPRAIHLRHVHQAECAGDIAMLMKLSMPPVRLRVVLAMKVHLSQHPLLSRPMLHQLTVISGSALPGVKERKALNTRAHKKHTRIDSVPSIWHHRRIDLLLCEDGPNVILDAVFC